VQAAQHDRDNMEKDHEVLKHVEEKIAEAQGGSAQVYFALLVLKYKY
jgi:hypothetical protein